MDLQIKKEELEKEYENITNQIKIKQEAINKELDKKKA